MSFYKMDPAAWDFGTADLSLEEEAAYLRIVNAIHKHEGPVPDNDRVLAGLFRASPRKARALVKALVEAGKLVIEDGKISALEMPEAAVARRDGIPMHVKRDVWMEGSCRYCGAVHGPFEIDHIIPWSRGGGNHRDNLTLACRPCNRSKRDKTVEEWMN